MGISSFFSSLFGKAKKSTEDLGESAATMADTAINKTESFTKNVVEKVADAAEHASHKLEELDIPDRMDNFIDSAKEKASQAADWAEDKAHDAKDVLSGMVDKVEDTISGITGTGTAQEMEETTENKVADTTEAVSDTATTTETKVENIVAETKETVSDVVENIENDIEEAGEKADGEEEKPV